MLRKETRREKGTTQSRELVSGITVLHMYSAGRKSVPSPFVFAQAKGGKNTSYKKGIRPSLALSADRHQKRPGQQGFFSSSRFEQRMGGAHSPFADGATAIVAGGRMQCVKIENRGTSEEREKEEKSQVAAAISTRHHSPIKFGGCRPRPSAVCRLLWGFAKTIPS